MKTSSSMALTLLNALAFANADNPSEVRNLLRRTSQQQITESEYQHLSCHSDNTHPLCNHAEISLASRA